MTDYYKEKLKQGEKYQKFIEEVLKNVFSIEIVCYSDKRDQYNIGENKQGIEIKYDHLFSETGNLYIEVSEKTHPGNKEFIPSGIMRMDNSWLYLIGNYSFIFIFGKKTLVRLYNSREFKEVGNDTSRGFLLHESIARQYAEVVMKNRKDK